MVTAKDLDVRQELLNTALEFFYDRGYDLTSIQAIIDRVGVSKGAFYHYFKSKEEILEAIVQQFEEPTRKLLQRIVENDQLNALAKINRAVQGIQEYRSGRNETFLKLHRIFKNEGNIKLQQELIARISRIAYLPFKTIIEQGVAEGIFNVTYPGETAEFIIHTIVNYANSVLAHFTSRLQEKPQLIESVKQKVVFYEEILERILGTAKGSIQLVEPVINILHDRFGVLQS